MINWSQESVEKQAALAVVAELPEVKAIVDIAQKAREAVIRHTDASTVEQSNKTIAIIDADLAPFIGDKDVR